MTKIKQDGDYQTISGLRVEIYRTEHTIRNLIHGSVETTGGLWESYIWNSDGVCKPNSMSLVERPLFDASSIPWDSLRDDISYIGMEIDYDGVICWTGSNMPLESQDCDDECGWDSAGKLYSLDGVKMPKVDPKHWRETLCQRPQL